jgi:hypothetical protein
MDSGEWFISTRQCRPYKLIIREPDAIAIQAEWLHVANPLRSALKRRHKFPFWFLGNLARWNGLRAYATFNRALRNRS